MSLGTLTSIDGSAGFPARGLVFMTFRPLLAFQVGDFGQTATMTPRAARDVDHMWLSLGRLGQNTGSATQTFRAFKGQTSRRRYCHA